MYLLSAGALRALDGVHGMGGFGGIGGSGGMGGMGVKTLGLDGVEASYSINSVCSVSMLRNVNVLLAALSPMVYAACRRKVVTLFIHLTFIHNSLL